MYRTRTYKCQFGNLPTDVACIFLSLRHALVLLADPFPVTFTYARCHDCWCGGAQGQSAAASAVIAATIATVIAVAVNAVIAVAVQ